MKKIFFLTLLAAIFVIAGCKKEEMIKGVGKNSGSTFKSAISSELEMLYQQLPPVNFGNITLLNGDILKFESFEHYERVYEGLLMQYREWTQLFFDEYDTGCEEELYKQMEQLGFSECIPLRKFEDMYFASNKSLHSVNSEKETAWFSQGAVGDAPSDNIIPCPVEQVLFSKFHEVAIGDTICQMRSDGYDIHIPTSDIGYINIYRKLSTEELTSKKPDPGLPWPPNHTSAPVAGGTTGGGGGCHKSTWQNWGWQPHLWDANYKFYWTYYFRYRPFWGNVRTTVTLENYKWESNQWKKNYGAVCALGSNTKIYVDESTAWGSCLEGALEHKAKNTPNKAFKRTKSRNISYPHIGSSILRNNPNESEILVRLYGCEYVINAETKALK